MNMRLGIPAMGIAAAIGMGKVAVGASLFEGRSGLALRNDLLRDRATYVGAARSEPPALPRGMEELDSRNNRLMAVALDEIAHEIDQAARRFGRHRIAVVLGTSTAGIAEGEAAYERYAREGAWPAGFHYRQQELGSLSECAAQLLNLNGPAFTVATACSSSGKVFASARRLINAGVCDAAVVGGADTVCRMTVGGFAALEALSSQRCNPFSIHRDGINIGEAAAAFLLTPEPARVALLGVGESSDAHHISAPDPIGRGASAAMSAALADAELDAVDIDYVNLHGTGTLLNDLAEGKAVNDLFGPNTPCSSTKALTGHTLGAAGACEAAFLWLTLNSHFNAVGSLPPHVWDGAVDPTIAPVNLVKHGTIMHSGRVRSAALSNSFAFGGSNVAVLMGSGY